MLSKILETKLSIIKIIFFTCLFVITFNSILYFLEKFVYGDRFLFDDLVLNYCAGILYSQNISPYGFGLGKTPLIDCVKNVIGGDWGMPAYFYSTFYLRILSIFSDFSFDTVKNIWFVLCFFSFFLILFFSYKVLPINKFKKTLPLIIFVSFGGILIKAFTSGNLSIFVYGLLSLSLFFLHKNYKIIFCSMIILISLVKPHHFIFLIIGILVYEKEFLKYAIISTLIVIFIFFLEFTYNNELFLSYLSNLHASTTPEFFFSYNATVGLKSVIQNLPTNIAEQFNFYISAGPNLIKNLLWFFLTFFILIGSILYRTTLKIKNLNNLQKSKLIAFGCITTTIINPNLAVYEFFLFIPSILFLIDNFKFKLSFLESEKIKYLIILSFVIVQDINFPLFCSAIVFFYILYYDFKKNDIRIFKK